jgi:hypothetical protein
LQVVALEQVLILVKQVELVVLAVEVTEAVHHLLLSQELLTLVAVAVEVMLITLALALQVVQEL